MEANFSLVPLPASQLLHVVGSYPLVMDGAVRKQKWKPSATIYSLKVRIQVLGVARNCARYLMSIVNQVRQALPIQASILGPWSSALLIRIIWALPGIT